MARTIIPFDLFIYDYRVGDVQQSVSDENQLKRIGHTETVLRRLVSEFDRLPLAENDAGRDYVCMKAQGLLLSYLTTVMLVDPDRKQGRKIGAKMMEFFRQQLPSAYKKAWKQYAALRLMNHLHISKKYFEAVLRSKLYNKLRRNHDFN